MFWGHTSKVFYLTNKVRVDIFKSACSIGLMRHRTVFGNPRALRRLRSLSCEKLVLEDGRPMYEERFYRSITRPLDLICYEVKIKETDLLCCTTENMEDFIEDRVLFYRNQLEEYIRIKPAFKESLLPVEDDRFAPLMVAEDDRGVNEFSVSGRWQLWQAPCRNLWETTSPPLSDEYVVENGG